MAAGRTWMGRGGWKAAEGRRRLLHREGHPVLWSLDDETEDATLSIRYAYFETTDPSQFDDGSTDTDGDASLKHSKTYEWNHGIGEIVTALIDAGLELEYLHEYRFSEWQALPG